MSTTTSLGKILKELRKLRGLTQEDLAMQTGRSVDAVSQWERGVNWPNFDTIERLAKALDVPVKAFFDNKDETLTDRKRLEMEASLIISKLSESDLRVAIDQLRAFSGRRC